MMYKAQLFGYLILEIYKSSIQVLAEGFLCEINTAVAHFLQGLPRLPSQLLVSLIDIGNEFGHVALSPGSDLEGQFMAKGILEAFNNLEDTVATSTAQVEHIVIVVVGHFFQLLNCLHVSLS